MSSTIKISSLDIAGYFTLNIPQWRLEPLHPQR
jgi:hypothetical protein